MTLRSILAAGAGALLASAVVVLGAPTAVAADDAASCLAADGVWVVVQDPGSAWQISGCAEAPTTGEDALTSIGITELGHRDGIICEMAGHPAGECARPFDGKHYWSYWHRSGPDAQWEYSREGAGTRKPTPGSMEGWRFGSGQPPGDVGASATAAPAGSSTAPSASPETAPASSGSPTGVTITLGLVAAAALALAVWWWRGRARS